MISMETVTRSGQCEITGRPTAGKYAMGTDDESSLTAVEREISSLAAKGRPDECIAEVPANTDRAPKQRRRRGARPTGASDPSPTFLGTAIGATELAGLAASEERFAKAFRLSPAAIAITRKRDGLFIEVNEAVQRMLQFSPEELVGHTTAELRIWVRPSDRARLVKALSKQGRITDAEFLFRRKDGEIVVSSYSAEVVEIGGEQCILALVNDVTESKRAKDELRKAHEELERRVVERTQQLADTNDELEAFSYSLSHDLRAPLRAMDGFSHILMEDYTAQLSDDMRELLQRIRAAAARMGDLIDGMLRLSRLARAELHFAEVDLSEIVRAAACELRDSAPARLVRFTIEPDLKATADPDLAHAVLQNLLANAWKYTSTRNEGTIEFGRTENAGRRCFFVRDNGVGFQQAYAADIFTPFQRLHGDPEFAGTGIGLSTVRRIVRRHGGEVWAEGVLDAGATFYFTLAPG